MDHSNYLYEKEIMIEVVDSLNLSDTVEIMPDSQGKAKVLATGIPLETSNELKKAIAQAFGDRIANHAVVR